MISIPINLLSWIDENREFLKPPVGNKLVWKDRDFIVMMIGGPNMRDDYHVNQGEEFFYQIEGDMVLRTRNNEGKFEDTSIKEGEILLLPGGVPHSPQRPAGSVGLVIEKRRPEGQNDAMVWYCKKCEKLLFKNSFHLTNIETQIKEAIEKYHEDEANKKCKECGHLN
jgi:3-hydroxyanthranilate 3,4-dioxygenase